MEAGYWGLVLVGVVASVVAAFFYLRVVVLMFMRDPEGEIETDPTVFPRFVVAVPALLVLVIGVLPGVVIGFLDKASVLRW
jgi:NADH-quinone oxidoreductase subunit N